MILEFHPSHSASDLLPSRAMIEATVAAAALMNTFQPVRHRYLSQVGNPRFGCACFSMSLLQWWWLDPDNDRNGFVERILVSYHKCRRRREFLDLRTASPIRTATKNSARTIPLITT
jgi:hypothetical protein